MTAYDIEELLLGSTTTHRHFKEQTLWCWQTFVPNANK